MLVLILGAAGQLGRDLCRVFRDSPLQVTGLTHADLDICEHARTRETLASLRPYAVINVAAFHKVEACEQDPERAFAVNCLAVRNLALACDQLGCHLVHISSDYVFGGDRSAPYGEDAPLNPLNVYGVSKAAGEYFVRNLCRRHLLVRTSGLYGLGGSSGKGGNFVETMLRLGRQNSSVSVVTDQRLSPTWTLDLASMLRRLVEAQAMGVFHITNRGSCSWYEFAEAIFEISELAVAVHPTTTASIASPVGRPAYSVLGNHRLEKEGFGALRPWREALKSYLEVRANTPAVRANIPAAVG